MKIRLPGASGGTPHPFDPSKIDLASLHKERRRVVERVEANKPPITRVLPVRRLISIGGRACVVGELTLNDLAEIQAWLEEQEPHPLDGIPPEWADDRPETRKERLKVAWEAAATWPPRFGTDRASVHMGSPLGRAFLLTLVAVKSQPDWVLADSVRALVEATPIEWAVFTRIAYAVSPRMEIANEIGRDGEPSRLTDWCKSLDQVMTNNHLTYREMGDLTLSQWRNLCNQGKIAEFTREFSLTSDRVRRTLGA